MAEYNPDKKPTVIKVILGALGTFAAAATIIAADPGILDGCNRTNPLDRYTPCSYTIQRGDTITDICKSEGFSGAELKGCIDQVCRDNKYNRMPDGITPVFDPVSGSCDSMKAGGKINFVDRDGDGYVNGQECE